MIRRLRWRLIFVTMCSLFTVLILILGVVNVASVVATNRDVLEVLNILSENDGAFPKEFAPTDSGSGKNRVSPETPFETRFFSVIFDGANKAVAANTSSIAAVDDEKAVQLARTVSEKKDNSGALETYRYLITHRDDGTRLVVFVDYTRQLRSIRILSRAGLIVGLCVMLMVFALIYFLSDRVVAPIADSYEKQRQFITDAGHELKTPLTIIDANNAVLELDYGENEWTESTKNQVKRLSHLVNELISLSRMDESRVMKSAKFDLSSAVLDTAEPFVALAKTKNMRFSLDIERGIEYTGSEQGLRRLVGILADNAVKFSSEPFDVRLTLKKQGRDILLECENPASGFSQGAHNELFERFYRADSARGSGAGGYGLGLSIAKSIVLSHKGKITAVSPDGKSLVLTITL